MKYKTYKNNEYLKSAKKLYNDGYYKKAESLVNEYGEEFANYAMTTCLVDYPSIRGTNLSGIDLVYVLISNGISLDDAESLRLHRGGSDGMDDLIGYAKTLMNWDGMKKK